MKSRTRETDIVYDKGVAWVHRDTNAYVVYRSGIVHSESDSAYPLTDDGLSIAKARTDYLTRNVKVVDSDEAAAELCSVCGYSECHG